MNETHKFHHAVTGGNYFPLEFVASDDVVKSIKADPRFEGEEWKLDVSGGLKELMKRFRRLNKMRSFAGIAPAVLVLPLSACGNDGEESLPEVAGRAIDGYLGGSKVFLSDNPGVFVFTSSEAGQQGIFSGLFGTGSIVVQGGIDTSTGKEFKGELRAPEGATVVTPLTTIVEAVVRTAIESGGAPVSIEEASAKIAKGLGLSADSDLLKVDFIAEDSGGTAKAAAQVASVLSLVTAAGGAGAATAAIEKVAQKISIAADSGVKSTILTNTAQLKEVLTEVAAEGKFVASNNSVDVLSVVNNIAEVVQVVNAKIAVATSVKDILATQSAVQDQFVTSFSTGVIIDVAVIDAIVEEAVAEIEAYFEELAELGIDTGIDVNEELVLSDVDLEIVEETIEEIVEEVGGGGGGGTPGDTEIGPQDSDVPDDGKILNFNTGDVYDDLQLAIDEATEDDILLLGSGRFNVDVKIDKSLSIYGANFDQAINANADGSAKDGFVDANGDADASGILFDTQDGLRANNESWIDGSITVMADDVTLNGLRLHSYEGALQFRDDDIDNFTLKHSYVTGFEAQGALAYADDFDDDSTNNDGSTGWLISGNLIGGVAGGVGGSMYLDGLADSEISENIFWRPGAAHLYADNLDNVEFNGNFFYHGLHAGGANFDSMLSELRTMDNNYGYVGFNGGKEGYGYGFGYGGADGYGMAPAGYGGYAGGYGLAGYGGYGYGYGGYGGGYGGEWEGFYGRNYWIELKSSQNDITFDGNVGQYNSGGIQFWDEGDANNVFTNIQITDNLFMDFINADPGGNLVDAGTRHKSGLVSGIVWETSGDSASANLVISGNKILSSIEEIYNYDPNKPSDLVSLIDIKGGLTNLFIEGNELLWDGTLRPSADTSNVNPVITQGIHLAGELNNFVFLVGNSFDTDTTSANYGSVALALNAVDYSSSGFGELDSANFNSTVDLAWADWLAKNTMPTADKVSLFGGDGTPKNGFYVITGDGSYGNYEYKLSEWLADVQDGSLDAGDYPSYLIFDDQTADFLGTTLVQIGLLVDDVKPTPSNLVIATDANSDRIVSDTTPTLTFRTSEQIDTTKAQLVELGTVGTSATNFAVVAATNGAAENLTVTFSGMQGSQYEYTAELSNATLTDGVWGLRLVDASGNIYDSVATDSNYNWPVLSANTIQIDTTADNGDDLVIEFGGNGSGGTVNGSSATNLVVITGVDDDAMSVVVSAVDSNGAVIEATKKTYLRDTSNGNLYLSTDGSKAAVDLSALNIDVLNNKGAATGPYSAKVVVTDLAGNVATAGSDKSADGGNALSLVLSGEGSDDTYAFFETQSVTVNLDGIDGDVNKITTYGIDGKTFLGALKTFADSTVAQYQSTAIDELAEIKAALADWQLVGEASSGVLKFQNVSDNSVYATFDLATTGVVSSVDTSISHVSEADSVTIDLSSFATDGDVPIKVFAKAEDDTGNIAYVADDISAVADIISVSNIAATIAETAAGGAAVGTYALPNGVNSVSLSDDAGGRFEINSSTGAITVANPFLLDYESDSSHTITILTNTGVTQNVKIGVSDVAAESFTITKVSKSGADVTFGVYIHSDADLGQNINALGVALTYNSSEMTYKSSETIFVKNGVSVLAVPNAVNNNDGTHTLTVTDTSLSARDYDLSTNPLLTFVMTLADANDTEVGFRTDTANCSIGFETAGNTALDDLLTASIDI